MPRKNTPLPTTHDHEHVVPYTRSGRYLKGQRVLHPRFGLGSVIKVKTGKVIILFDDLQEQSCRPGREKGERIFLSAKLNLAQRRSANGMDENASLPAYEIVQDVLLQEISEIDGLENQYQEDSSEPFDDVDDVA